MSTEDDFAAFRRVAGEEIAKLREENASLRAHAERVGQANDRLAVENDALRGELDFWRDGSIVREEDKKELIALRATAVEACALARVWVTVWGDKLSAESIKRLGELEKQILKEAKP